MSFKPIKSIKCTSITNITTNSTMTLNGTAGVPYKWNVTLHVVAQAHSDPSSTPVAYFYTGQNVNVGDWITTDATGKSLKIIAISSQTSDAVACTLEDIDNANALTDDTGNLDGMIPNGAGIEGFVFSVVNNVPLIGNIPAAISGNLSGSDFVNNIQSRFASTSTVGIDSSTGKLDASILPAPVPGGSAGAVKIATTGPFVIDSTTGSLKLADSIALSGTPSAPTATAGSNTTQVATTAFVHSEITNIIGAAPDALNTLVEIATQLAADETAATALTNTVALKAPLESPTFSGAPKSVTPSSGDNSTKIATTEFVANAISGLSSGGTGGNGTGAGTTMKPWAVKSADYTAVAGDSLFVDTASGPVTITLPASPATGDMINFIDYSGAFDINNLTIAHSSIVLGSSSSLIVDVPNARITLVYTGAAKGWIIGSTVVSIANIVASGVVVSTDSTAAVNSLVYADTSTASFTLTLPASPSVGSLVLINDYSGAFDTNNLTVASNGLKILGTVQDLVIDVSYQETNLIYSGSDRGWILA